MIIRHRLAILGELITEYGLEIQPHLVSSANNIADKLTRVPRKWIEMTIYAGLAGCVVTCEPDAAKAIREFMLKITLASIGRYFWLSGFWVIMRPVQKCGKLWKRAKLAVKLAVKKLDPSPIQFPYGHLSVDRHWARLAMDITHYDGKDYLSIAAPVL